MGKIKNFLLYFKNNWHKQNGFGDGDSSLWKPFIKKQQDNIDLASLYNTNHMNNDIHYNKTNTNNPVTIENIDKQNNNEYNDQNGFTEDKQNNTSNIFSVQPEDSIKFWQAAGVIYDPSKTDKKAKRLKRKNNPDRPKNFFKRILWRFGNIKKRIDKFLYNLSIKQSFMLYMLVFLILALILSVISVSFFSNLRMDIYFQYQIGSEDGYYSSYVPYSEYSASDRSLMNFYSSIAIWSVPVIFIACIIAAALLFYKNKLKKPIDILNGASKKIANNNLDFKIQYDSKDEMGQLCSSFEKMRISLSENNSRMWRSMEERKRLNAAFAHDLRTPLTVLRGYTDLLSQYLPQDKIPKDKVMSTVNTMSGHITRLENYVISMNTLQKLEDIEINPKNIYIKTLVDELEQSACILANEKNVQIHCLYKILMPNICIDKEIVIQVFENLISNAIRYAKTNIDLIFESFNNIFSISVSDDGPGFSQDDLEKAANPYYRGKNTSDDIHFGLGLNICKILCEIHHGTLIFKNNENNGGYVKATFQAR